MRSLVLKDMLIIKDNIKSFFFFFFFMLCIWAPSGKFTLYICTATIICSMMTITCCALDATSDWAKYAMIMPLTKRDLVRSKYVGALIFSAIGAIIGLGSGIIAGVALQKIPLTSETLAPLFLVTLLAFIIAIALIAPNILLVFMFGVEKSRIFFILTALVLGGIAYGLYEFTGLKNLTAMALGGLALLFLVAWVWIMYRICCAVFEKAEL